MFENIDLQASNFAHLNPSDRGAMRTVSRS